MTTIELDQYFKNLNEYFDLTLFQIDFIKTIIYFNDNYGPYGYNESYVLKTYSEVDTDINLKKSIKNLIDEGIIIKEVRKNIYNGKFITTCKLFYNNFYINNK